jgi:hypothetical protein
MRIEWGALCLTCLTFAAAPAATAQVFQGPTTIDNRPQVDVSIETLFDTNISRSSAALAADRGLKQEDWVYSPNVSVDLTRPIGPEAVFLVGDIGYDFHQTDTVLNRERIDMQGGAKGQFGPCHATLSGSVDRHQSYLEDVAVAAPFVSNTQELTSVNLDGGCSRSVGLGVELSAAESWEGNSSAQFQTFDYRQTTVTGSLVYQRPNFGKLSAFGQYDHSDYPNQIVPSPTPALGNEYDLYAGGIRYERDIGARISATVSLAYTSLTTRSAVGFNGFTYSGDLTYRVSGRLSAHISAERAARPAVLNDAAFLVEQTYLAEAVYSLSTRVSVSAGASEQTQHFGGVILMPTIAITDSRLTDYYTTARVFFGRRFYVGIDGRYEVRRADVSELNYNDARVGVTLGARL